VSDSRKATDVLLSIEQKLEKLIELLQNNNLSDKILSNKLNTVISSLSEKKNSSPIFTAEAVNISVPSTVPVVAEEALHINDTPASNGFSRTSRSETFAGDNSYFKKIDKKEKSTKMPIQIPKGDYVEVIVPTQTNEVQQTKVVTSTPATKLNTSNVVSVVQRVVDKNGKSLFLADVEIINKDDLQVIQKLKTNATGKWMCSLPIGQYSVLIKKRDHITKQIVEIGQNLEVNGSSNPLELPMAIIK